jgi:hypothetical protein
MRSRCETEKAEFLVGIGRYQFDAADVDTGETSDQPGHTAGFGETHP